VSCNAGGSVCEVSESLSCRWDGSYPILSSAVEYVKGGEWAGGGRHLGRQGVRDRGETRVEGLHVANMVEGKLVMEEGKEFELRLHRRKRISDRCQDGVMADCDVLEVCSPVGWETTQAFI
jgi:hypothetical protein